MAFFNYQSVAVYSDSGTAWVNIGEGNNISQLGDGEFGGVAGTTFESGDILDSGSSVTGNLLYVGSVTSGGETFVVGLDVFTGNYILYSSQSLQSPSQFPSSFPDSQIDTGPFVVCFATGTEIGTPSGARRVEELAPGDPVRTADGRDAAVKWVGRQRVMPAFGPAERLAPVRIAAGALGKGVPYRDLTVSADHGMIVEGIIAHAGALVNGASITRVPVRDLPARFDYWHVETDAHEVILANGAPVETFIDNVSRRVFDNHGEFLALYGDVPEMEEMPLPRAMSARQVPPRVREYLMRRASAMGLAATRAASG